MRLIIALTLLAMSSVSHASTVKLNYSVLFSYMKTMYKLDYPYVTTAFYLVDRNDKSLCQIKNASMVVENKVDPILFEKNGRLLPFYSDKHRKDGGMIMVDIEDGQTVSSCDLQISVMAKERELSSLDETKLAAISEQLEGVLKKNAGMIGKYFLPTFEGVRLKFSEPLTDIQVNRLGDGIQLSAQGELLLSNNLLNNITAINELNVTLVRITPWMINNK